MTFRRYAAAVVVLVLAVVAAIVAAPSLRTSLLRAMGHFLVSSDQLRHADVIVLSVDSYGAGVLEAADLVHERVADRVALFADPPDNVDREFQRRGVWSYNAAIASVKQLHELGVDAVEVIPRPVVGTDDESRILLVWCGEHHYRAVVFISTTDHSRRTARVMARATRNRGLELIVHASRYSRFNPDTWWESRSGVRIEIVETEKLLADILLHPFS